MILQYLERLRTVEDSMYEHVQNKCGVGSDAVRTDDAGVFYACCRLGLFDSSGIF